MPSAPNVLPPVSPGRLGASGGGKKPLNLAPAQWDQGADHPFDTPFSVMKTMQAELIRLREDLQKERSERKAEDAALRRDLTDLRDTVNQNRDKQQADHDRVGHAVKLLEEKADQDLRACRKELEAELAKRCTVVQYQALSDMADETAKRLNETRNLLQSSVSSLERSIQANTDADQAFANGTNHELTHQRQQLDENSANDEAFAREVLQRMKQAGRFLKTAGNSARGGDTLGDKTTAGLPSPPAATVTLTSG